MLCLYYRITLSSLFLLVSAMSLIPKNSKSLVKTTTSRRRSTTSVAASRRRLHSLAVTPQRKNGKGLSKVSDKLEALKNLIPTQYGDNVKADQLFQETADYIVQLRTQIFVLQRLIKFYGSTNSVTDNVNAEKVRENEDVEAESKTLSTTSLITK